tara:strand:+ start:530 stop:694 length:165 start_codon:yes stop_codon:yes gene_type:complete
LPLLVVDAAPRKWVYSGAVERLIIGIVTVGDPVDSGEPVREHVVKTMKRFLEAR